MLDVADAIPKDILPMMEHPFYSLSKKPYTKVRRYEHGENYLEITPSVKGLATIYDKDLLIYCTSQIVAKMRNGEKATKRVQLNTHELLIFANRGTAGKDYAALQEAIERLAGTRITTNIKTGDLTQTDTFGLIESSSIKRKHGLDGRLLSCEITLSDWVFNAIQHHEVLTLHRDYFRLGKPIDRRVYELARKHCGAQQRVEIGLDKLHKKSGSSGDLRKFRLVIRGIAQSNHLPDYLIEYDDDRDMVVFVNRGTVKLAAAHDFEPWSGRLDPDALEEARNSAPGWDIHYVEQQWRNWLGENEIEPKNPGRHFVKFCQTWFEKRGRPS